MDGTTMKCAICSNTLVVHANAVILGKYEAKLMHCRNCGLLMIPEPYWLSEAYSHPIAENDTGLMLRNLNTANDLTVLLYFILGERGKGCYLDVGGGYGILVRLMRDRGFNFYWEDHHCQNLLARGFEYSGKERCSAVTAMEVLEHVEDPVAFLQEAFERSGAETVIFSTELYGDEPPDPATWSYYCFETGQHISFYQRRTLETVAKKLGALYYGYANMHIVSRRPLPWIMLRLLSSRLRRLCIGYVQSRMKTLVFQDHEYIRNLYRDGRTEAMTNRTTDSHREA